MGQTRHSTARWDARIRDCEGDVSLAVVVTGDIGLGVK